MTFRERVEEKPTVWLLSALFAGFVAGVGTYEAILRIAQLEVVSKTDLRNLRQGTALRTAGWSGFWETDTGTYKNLRIRFIDTNGHVVGTYSVPGPASSVPAGRIEGKSSGNALVGRWVERLGARDLAGEIHFVLFEDGRSFVGSYTREWEGQRAKHVWSGRKID